GTVRKALELSPHTIPYSSLSFLTNAPPTTANYTLSLHDALPISANYRVPLWALQQSNRGIATTPLIPGQRIILPRHLLPQAANRSEEHTSELQSLAYLVCRLLLEKKKKTTGSERRANEADGRSKE